MRLTSKECKTFTRLRFQASENVVYVVSERKLPVG